MAKHSPPKTHFNILQTFATTDLKILRYSIYEKKRIFHVKALKDLLFVSNKKFSC